MDFEFAGEVIAWRGPSPYHFVRVPEDLCDDLRDLATDVTYGWGMIPVIVVVEEVEFETSLWPKDGGYLLPLKDRVRTPAGLEVGSPVRVGFSVATRDGRPVD